MYYGANILNDYLDFFEQYKSIKEIADLINEIKQLRQYFSSQRYDEMNQHIISLTNKYSLETKIWNSTH